MPDKDSESQARIQVSCPEQWKRFVLRFVLIVEASYRLGIADFRLRPPRQIKLVITPSQSVHMKADWLINRIDVGLPYHPSASIWLFSAYFGLAHEVGHLLWHIGPLTLREAWANYFALSVLESRYTQRLLLNRVDRILLTKDFWLSFGILKFQLYIGNPVESAIANIVRVLRKSGNEQVSAFLYAVGEAMETKESILVSKFSQYFNIPKATCKTWLRDE